jgi:hypothetical protein
LQSLQNPSPTSGDNLINARCKGVELSGAKRGTIWKKKLISLKQTVRTKIREPYIEA